MSREHIAVAARAFAAARVRFAEGGRDPARGLDCGGLVIAAAAVAGYRLGDIGGYALGGHSDLMARILAQLERDFERVDGEWEPGDVLALRNPPLYNHLAVFAGRGEVVHAYDHQAARRVVITPVDAALRRRVTGAWRVRE